MRCHSTTILSDIENITRLINMSISTVYGRKRFLLPGTNISTNLIYPLTINFASLTVTPTNRPNSSA